MKAELEIMMLSVKDIVTASAGEDCPYDACPGLEWDEFAMEG